MVGGGGGGGRGGGVGGGESKAKLWQKSAWLFGLPQKTLVLHILACGV